MDVISKLLGAFISVALFFYYPTYQQAQRQDDLSQMVVNEAVRVFVDSVRTKGYISPQMYLEFNQKLGATGNQYDLKMEHKHKKYNPVYADPADPTSFQNDFITYYDAHYEDEIMSVLFPVNSEPKDSEARRYILATNDFFKVEVKNINRPLSVILKDFLLGSNTGENTKIFVRYGGMVLNEDYY
ncbi:hypothetical protein [Bacillus sp. FSL K6-6540]|uniref:hypothetical protein n=1 Tax=Bacillus sp. FSL K6-6540 TaxID=2921512 RepID=UPI0030F5D02B